VTLVRRATSWSWSGSIPFTSWRLTGR
jgi:hypothetical protein